MIKVSFILGTLLAATSLQAQDAALPFVGDCAIGTAHARNVDWSNPTRTFANGAIRLVALDTVEPAAAAAHVMVLHPAADGPGARCTLVSAGPDRAGFQSVDLARADATYDPADGLTVRIPAFEDAPVHPTPLSILVTVNQQTGAVGARFGPL